MGKSPNQRQRADLTTQEKLEIIDSLKNKKRSCKDIQEQYKISKCTLHRILQHENELRANKDEGVKRNRSADYRLVDQAVSKWYRSMQEQNIYVNGPLLRREAVKIAKDLNINDFKPNNGWVWRWQKRENVKFLKKSKKNTSGNSFDGECWTGDHAELGQNSSRESLDEMNISSGWHNILAMAALPGEQIKANDSSVVKNETDAPGEESIVIDSGSENEENSNNEDSSYFHLGLSENGEGLETATKLKCFLCHKTDKVEPFTDESFEKCLNSMKFGNNKLKPDDKYKFGFHKKCFDNVIKINQKWSKEYEKMLQKKKQTNNEDELTMEEDLLTSFLHRPFEIKNEPPEQNQSNDSTESTDGHRIVKNEKRQQDIYSIYGDYIAERLRASANEREKHEIFIAQHHIDEVLFKLSMGSYARLPQELSRSVNGAQNDVSSSSLNKRTPKQSQRSVNSKRAVSDPFNPTEESNIPVIVQIH